LNPNSNNPKTPKLLNVGCGARFHASWTNIDLESSAAEVRQHDITRGLPFADNHFDALYHSHVLEHLDPSDGEKLLDECFRVLKPTGLLRIVVPNLEQIATLYLNYHRQAWNGEKGAAVNYRWMKLELLDQLVRTHSGGRMGQYMASDGIKNIGFVRSRFGDEFFRCQEIDQAGQGEPVAKQESPSFADRAGEMFANAKTYLARRSVRYLMGKAALKSFEEGLFRSQGEIHRWMYDRYSLKQLCLAHGFVDFKVRSATDSGIENYESFELDSENGNVRKPDSLFVECRKGVAQQAKKAA